MDDCVEFLSKSCVELVGENINLSVPWYLMASYAYYVMDDPILTDSVFDRMTNRMLGSWHEIEHPHKDLITIDMLEAGTYFGEYPSKVEGAVKQLKGTCKNMT